MEQNVRAAADPSQLALAQARELAMAPSLRSGIAPFLVMEIVRKAAQLEAAGRSILHLEIGQPGTPAPRAAREAAKAAIDSGTLGYTEALGMPRLRARIAQLYQDWYGLHVSPDRVIVTSGSSAGFVLAFLALFDAGDPVGLPSPGYPCYRQVLKALGCKPVLIETGPATRWMPTPEGVEAAAQSAQLKGLLIASPANPTGTMLEPTRLAAILEVCQRRHIRYISDEIYHGLTFAQPAVTALSFSEEAIVINSFSKYFSMTGWRVGWMVVPESLVKPMERLAQNLYICPPAVAQAAALGAFDGEEELNLTRKVYRRNRDLLLAGLPKVGFNNLVPADGAFYIYADVSEFTRDSVALAGAMLEEIGVAVTPGVDFDEARGVRFLRFSYAGTTAHMEEALHRLAGFSQVKA